MRIVVAVLCHGQRQIVVVIMLMASLLRSKRAMCELLFVRDVFRSRICIALQDQCSLIDLVDDHFGLMHLFGAREKCEDNACKESHRCYSLYFRA
jgi:hypothetical protein